MATASQQKQVTHSGLYSFSKLGQRQHTICPEDFVTLYFKSMPWFSVHEHSSASVIRLCACIHYICLFVTFCVFVLCSACSSLYNFTDCYLSVIFIPFTTLLLSSVLVSFFSLVSVHSLIYCSMF